MKLSPTMVTGLRTVASKDPKGTPIAWRTGPHMVASGTADALVARGLCTMGPGGGLGHYRLHITDAGRAHLADLDAAS